MGRRIAVYVDDDLLEALNEHTQASPLSRSELVGVAVRRFIRDERRRAVVPTPETHLARRIARGELPSRIVDGRRVAGSGAPYGN
jgi:hypothetical protein